jgi:serine/threonine protein kinase
MLKKQALVVGIDAYQDFPLLRQAAHDADEISNVLAMPEYDFNISLLTNKEADTKSTNSQISSLFSEDASLRLFYFAGHGISIDTSLYLCTHDGTMSDPGIDLSALKNKIVTAKGTVVIILDCCHAGAAEIRDLKGYRNLSEGDLDRALGDLVAGKILIAACGEEEKAQESESLRHGIFTHCLLEGLLGPSANMQGIITPMGLYDFIAAKLQQEYNRSPVWKGDQKGLIVLGTGFSATQLDTKDKYDISTQIREHLEKEARDLIADYFTKTKVPYDQWKSSGYKQACQLLDPILRWFGRQSTEYPGIVSSSNFNIAHREAQKHLAELGAVDIGYHIDEGLITECVGAGAFGTVYKVESPNKTTSAYKVFHSSELNTPEKVNRFHRGYRAMNQLNHPFIVKVHKYTYCPVGFYMDFIEGPNLKDWSGSVTEPTYLISMLIKIAETLKHAHGRNVIHRDIKPENIIMSYDQKNKTWEPYLTDFDLAWFSTATQVTKEAFGVIFYAAPEQLSRPQSKIAHAETTDVYSFGQLSYFIATGSNPVPFHGADNVRALKNRIRDWRTVEASSSFLQLYSYCTQDEPGKRPSDFRDIINTLHQIYQLLTDTSKDQIFEQDNFIRELSYQLVGLPESPELINSKSLNSLSGRTTLEFTDIKKDSTGEFNIKVKLISPILSLSGITSDKARHSLNTRLDKALAGLRDFNRTAGTTGPYNVNLVIHHIPPTLVGVEKCRNIISKAIDSIESF